MVFLFYSEIESIVKFVKNVTLLLLVFVLFSCSKEETSSTPEPAQIPKYTVSIKAGDGGIVSSAGGTYDKDTQISVTATPNAEYLFQAWSDGNTDNPRSFKVLSDFSLTANFVKKQYDLTIIVVGEGAVTEEVVIQGGRYNSGSQIKLTATAAEGWEFTSWSGDLESTDNPVTFTIEEAHSITAKFVMKDSDGDGVTDDIDQCPDTPSGEEVNETGCSDSQIDSDGDGVIDSIDQDNSTREGVPVNENGVMLNPIYLDGNNITIKAYEWSISGDTGIINNVVYEVVDKERLTELRDSEGDLSRVVTSKITDLSYFFQDNTSFNEDISAWDVSNVTSLKFTFFGAISFKTNLSYWDVGNVTDFNYTFHNAKSFNSDLSNWNVSKGKKFSQMFWGAKGFNSDLNKWDISNAEDISYMFGMANSFNGNISSWDTSNINDLSGLFYCANEDCDFNVDISLWDVSNVTKMEAIFFNQKKFNQDLSGWDVSKVKNFKYAFSYTESFNSDISNWDTSNVTDMSGMFYGANFNRDISKWNVTSVVLMNEMFLSNKSFNQNLSSWNVSNVVDCSRFSTQADSWTLPKPNFTNCNPN